MNAKQTQLQLVEIKRSEPFTTSLVVADGCELQHKNTLSLIRRFQDDFEELGTLAFETRKSGGLPTEFAILNEDQATYLITLFRNTPIVRKFKLRLVKEFRRVVNELIRIKANHANAEWIEARKNGKQDRLSETDAVRRFVEHATAHGSRNAATYYMNITKGTYAALFMLEHGGKWEGLRECLSRVQLNTLASAERIAQKALNEAVEMDMPYRDGYKYAIGKVKAFAELIGVTKIPDSPPLALVKATGEKP